MIRDILEKMSYEDAVIIVFMDLSILMWCMKFGLYIHFYEPEDMVFELESVKIDMRYDDE